ncbi:4Fe-4S domain-containing protein [Cryptosporangium aurantiacum]|uniref:4Fe-4S single cluster domain of Ferredoxin I n=1 Tax=Cryptosporangium aurantiacum TaxID=134849 RepID=A0A1M7PUQ0_9ACTN|nr:ferredoxin [Cryptosporangium aurantiacum]SHN21171.1 4Fe-4S single cluster domain of Ferredoxin I [Cryptosporangium aurantiacum]
MEPALAAAADDAAAAAAVHVVAAAVGFASTLALWLSILIGIVLGRSWSLPWIKHTSLKNLHMTFAIGGLALGIVHGLAQLAAPGTYVRWIDQIIPFINPTKPIGVGLGTLCLEMFLAIALSVPVQRKLGHANWRIVHSTAYMAYTVTVGHLIFTGSEVKGWVTVVVVISWLITIALWFGTSGKFGKQVGAAAMDIADKRASTTTVNVNPHTCARFGFCEHEAPEVFQLKGNGRLAYRTTVEPHEVDKVYSAIKICPARAISMSGPGVPFDLTIPPGAQEPGAPANVGPTAGPGQPISLAPTADTRETTVVPHLAPVAPVSPVDAPRPIPTSPAVPPAPPVPAGASGGLSAVGGPGAAGAPRPTGRLGPFPPGGPGRRHGQPVTPPPPPLRSVPNRPEGRKDSPNRYDNVTGLRPRGGA